MNEFDRDKELQRWKRWKFLSFIGRVLKVGTGMRTDSEKWSSHNDEPPMLELEKLAREGFKDGTAKGDSNLEILEYTMTLFAAVTRTESEKSDEGSRIIRELIVEFDLPGIGDEAILSLMEKYRAGLGNFQQFRNDLFMLKKRIDRNRLKQLVKYLYRFVYRYGADSQESRQVADIARRLGLSHSDIRFAAVDVKREMEKQGDDSED